jgi:hypothetical protein
MVAHGRPQTRGVAYAMVPSQCAEISHHVPWRELRRGNRVSQSFAAKIRISPIVQS